jgi:protein-disulfide isomerase
MNRKVLVGGVAGLAFLLFGVGAFLYTAQKQQKSAATAVENSQAQSDSLVRAHSPVIGSASAKVTIVEFFDPACEACRAFYPLVKGMVNSSFGQVNLVLRYAAFHKGSDEAIKILEAARRQNQFQPVLEVMLKNQDTWAAHGNPNTGLLWDLIKETGIDVAKARTDARDPAAAEVLRLDAEDIGRLKVTRTPTFFVNGKPLTEFGPDQLQALVKREIALAYPK